MFHLGVIQKNSTGTVF